MGEKAETSASDLSLGFRFLGTGQMSRYRWHCLAESYRVDLSQMRTPNPRRTGWDFSTSDLSLAFSVQSPVACLD